MQALIDIAAANPALNSRLLLVSIAAPFLIGWFLIASGRLNTSGRILANLGFLLPLFTALWVSLASLSPESATTGVFAHRETWLVGLESIGVSLSLGLDGISLPLLLLTGVVGAAAGLYALQQKVERQPLYLALLLFILSGLVGVFASRNLFFIYFFHEFALIPTFILIGLWGGEDRKRAALDMTVYLTLGAMLSLLGLIALYASSGAESFDIDVLQSHLESGEIFTDSRQHTLYGLLLFGFGILVSLFPFHSWAPRGYAAAPAPAAMLHAGVLKKFGLYGLVQIALPLLPTGALAWNDWLIPLALGNILVIGLIAMTQSNLNQLIGYGSVMHMGYIFLGIAALSAFGVAGAAFLMVAHGCSVALLFLLSDCLRERTGTLQMNEMGGLYRTLPLLTGFFLAAIMASIGLPGLGNFWGEFAIFMSLWERHPELVLPAALGIIISAVYGLRAVSAIFFGEPTAPLLARMQEAPVHDLNARERLPVLLLLGTLLILGLFPRLISDSINERSQELLPQPILPGLFTETNLPSE
jgi:NADH-quinone oxidoreductase subunit M